MAESISSVAELPAPRRVAIATLFRDAWRLERELAALYAASVRRTPLVPLRAALEELAALKRAHVAALDTLAPALDSEWGQGRAVMEPTPVRETVPELRPEFFARAFDAERTLETTYREIAVLLDDPAPCPKLAALVTEAARHRASLRALYGRYT